MIDVGHKLFPGRNLLRCALIIALVLYLPLFYIRTSLLAEINSTRGNYLGKYGS